MSQQSPNISGHLKSRLITIIIKIISPNSDRRHPGSKCWLNAWGYI